MSVSAYYAWLKKDWAKTGLILAIFLFVFLVVFVKPNDFVLFLILLQTPLYMLHEMEEYVFPGGFAKFFNIDIFNLDTADRPMDENFIFYVNVGVVWIILPVFGLLSINNYQYGLWIPYFSFFAGVAHIALGLKARKLYNPGLIVSLVLNIPVSLWSIRYFADHQLVQNAVLNPYLAIGLGLNLLLPVIGFIVYRRYLKNESLPLSS
jgi:hypothetical protein